MGTGRLHEWVQRDYRSGFRDTIQVDYRSGYRDTIGVGTGSL